MKITKKYTGPSWTIWEGDEFPRQFHSDSIVFFTDTWIELDEDSAARASLARQIQREGLIDSLAECYKLVEEANATQAGYYYDDNDERYPIFCLEDDPLLDMDATFVEVAHVF